MMYRQIRHTCAKSASPRVRSVGLQLAATLALLLSASIGCRGYNMGNQFLYRSDIRTVHVGVFETESYRRFLGQRLTEAVVKEIELNTPLSIGEPAIADSFVQGRLVRERKRPMSQDRAGDPTVLQIGWILEVTWVDRAGVPLMPRQSLQLENFEEFVPEGGQSMGTAEQEMVERMAREIVGQMEMPW